jgi:hypothetical protein
MFRAGDRVTDRLAGREQDAWNIEPRAAGTAWRLGVSGRNRYLRA